ncbi:PTS glucose transporter subunit IIA [Paucisalibacillus sp. EB02]|uniref:PTS sugar transporter subunit IIA n=1 Tax=Paucisalibacillus sp. EB02 TaxID=1347087 RepID=UPI0004B779C2|nr:PTS glucose transporter subunit IIA [Paucisalibacillus sp. EB02]
MFKKLFNKSKESNEVQVYAPITGKLVSIEEVPDPVFSQKMMGEGAAIIPTDGKIVAPVNGEVIQVAPTKHAIGIKAEDGSEILLHIGLETVALKGEGFTVHVSQGDNVKVGDHLMDVDLNFIKENAKDIISPIVFTDSSNSGKNYHKGQVADCKAGETVIFNVE